MPPGGGGLQVSGICGRIDRQNQHDALSGRTPCGERVHDIAPAGQWLTTTMICSVRLDEPTACISIEEATMADAFQA